MPIIVFSTVAVAGCATGEEAYSLAILLREFAATLHFTQPDAVSSAGTTLMITTVASRPMITITTSSTLAFAKPPKAVRRWILPR